eukprot:12117850-Prorocentrum_lima.AAC.1
MTSSLVGSEMCIRDSGRSVQGSGMACSQGGAQSHPPCACTCTCCWGSGCLLYTSDAADDM